MGRDSPQLATIPVHFSPENSLGFLRLVRPKQAHRSPFAFLRKGTETVSRIVFLRSYCELPGFCVCPPRLVSALNTVTSTRRFFSRSSRVFSSFTGLSLPRPTIWMRYTGTL